MSKGVTPVLATALLIMISVAAVGSAALMIEDVRESLIGQVENQQEYQKMVENTDLAVDFAKNSSDGYLLIDIRNSGSVNQPLYEDNTKYMDLYIDNRPQEWEFVDDPGDDYSLLPGATVRINTTEKFPAAGKTVKASFMAPYHSSAAKYCSSQGDPTC